MTRNALLAVRRRVAQMEGDAHLVRAVLAEPDTTLEIAGAAEAVHAAVEKLDNLLVERLKYDDAE